MKSDREKMETTGDLLEGLEEKRVSVRTASKLSGMQLTERDLTILHFINDFGFCEMPQIEARFGLTKPRNYQIMEILITAGTAVTSLCHGKRAGMTTHLPLGGFFL